MAGSGVAYEKVARVYLNYAANPANPLDVQSVRPLLLLLPSSRLLTTLSRQRWPLFSLVQSKG